MYEYPADFNPTTNWVHQYMTWPRKYVEWVDLIAGFRTPLFPSPQIEVIALPPPLPYTPNTVPDAWYHRAEAADQFEATFHRNQWIRWQVRRLAMGIRRRICRRRVLGETDVGTMEPIPHRLCVRVQDWGTRSVYQFHAGTIHKHITEALRYQTLALSMPKAPKNPYTNLPWSFPQLLVLYEQMTRCLWNVGRQFLDPVAQAFYKMRLSLPLFQTMYGNVLDIECARRYFNDPMGEYWEHLYGDALDDMFEFLQPVRVVKLRALLIDRSFPTDMLRQWDELVLAFWCFDNLRRIVYPNACCIQDLIREATLVLGRTEAHMAEHMRKKTRPS